MDDFVSNVALQPPPVPFFEGDAYRAVQAYRHGQLEPGELQDVLANKSKLPDPILTAKLSGYRSGHWHQMTCAASVIVRLLSRSGDNRFVGINSIKKLGSKWPEFKMKECHKFREAMFQVAQEQYAGLIYMNISSST